MTDNKKGLNPAQVQAPQSAQQSSINGNEFTTPWAARPLDKGEAAVYLLLTTPSGITGLDLLNRCHLISGRNDLAAIERALGIRLIKEREPNAGAGSHYRYRIASREDCQRVIGYLNRLRPGKPKPITSEAADGIVALYPASTTSAA